MKRTMGVSKSAIALVLMALLYHQTCLAQVDAWERTKLIEQGKNVSVKLHSGQMLQGRMESWNTDGLSVRQGNDKVVPVAKSDVAQVAMVTGMSRGRKAAYAGLIAGGIGGGLTAVACVNSSSTCDVPPAALAAGGALVWGGIAAGIAALFPQHKEVIYAAPFAPSAPEAPPK